MDKIKAAPKARIVNLASLAHETAKDNGLDFDDLMWKKSYNEWLAYSASKLSNIYFTKGLARKFETEGITNVKACSVHPGVVRTELGRYMIDESFLRTFLLKYVMGPFYYLGTKSPWQGTQTQLHCCLMPFEEIENGKYYSDCAVKQEKIRPNYDGEVGKLWEWSEEAVKAFM